MSTLSVTEGGREGRGAALVIAGRLAIIGGRVDRHCPHTRRVAVTVAVVIGPSVTRGPHVDRAETVAALYNNYNNNERFIIRRKMLKQTHRRRSLHIGKMHDQHLEACCRGISYC